MLACSQPSLPRIKGPLSTKPDKVFPGQSCSYNIGFTTDYMNPWFDNLRGEMYFTLGPCENGFSNLTFSQNDGVT